ncbi:flagellar basal body rod protein FlgB [Halanaerobaculum tunisiense]
MKLFGTNIGVLGKALDGLQKKHQSISNNIANADTPNYKRKQVNFKQQLESAIEDKNQLAVTNKSHIALHKSNLSSVEPKMATEEDTKVRKDGNNVNIDAEMANLAKNTIKYQTVSKQLGNQFNRLQNVIKKGGK